MRTRANLPIPPAPRPQESVPASASQVPQEEAASPPARGEPDAEARQERDRRAFVVCGERGGVESMTACLRSYGSTGIVPGN